MESIKYRGYTIQKDTEGNGGMMFYKTSEGIQHDGDYYNESWHYCGNCKWEASVEDAKDAIDELWNEQEFPLAEDMGIKRGDTMFTGRGDQVTVVSTSTVPLTKNQIVVRGVKDKHSFYICADALLVDRPTNPIK